MFRSRDGCGRGIVGWCSFRRVRSIMMCQVTGGVLCRSSIKSVYHDNSWCLVVPLYYNRPSSSNSLFVVT